MRSCFRFGLLLSCLCVLVLGSSASANLNNLNAPPAWQCNQIIGTANADLIYGTSDCDLIKARAGDDNVYGRGTGDRLYGERGGDAIYGEGGADLVVAGCEGGTCNPGIYGNWLYGNSGNDVLGADNGYRDYLYGGDGYDICYVDSRDEWTGCEERR